MSDTSCKRVLSLSCSFNFPLILPVFFSNFTETYEFWSVYERDVAIGCIINFPVFMSKPSSYSKRTSKYCVL